METVTVFNYEILRSKLMNRFFIFYFVFLLEADLNAQTIESMAIYNKNDTLFVTVEISFVFTCNLRKRRNMATTNGHVLQCAGDS